MDNGWIKLHRKILKNAISKKPNYAWLWVTLLLKANHKENKFIWNGKEEVCEKGQILTGRKKLSQETGISETTIERILKMLENGHQIEQQKTNKFRLITVINWQEYQGNGHQTDNKRTSNGQQTDTNKNDKNDKNINIGASPLKYKWQDEGLEAVKFFKDGEKYKSRILKCFKDNNQFANTAFSDCKELERKNAMYFFAVYNKMNK
ncbi:hypothetical protein K8R33_05225 [archaeon]|nr:hypothetical protein [archaeon]